ncbi:DUF4453 domain-containing protein [Pontivivens insulae]|uniref:YARHG domain-containing protein n=1 Tax=Pontivivens insulae TaxID=1639689 RepID=A0A2R8A7Q6_9RHOB|nr:DUF4453 domain-containing protein [Pontivivens insulae]RED18171.1 YARHG domain-containing protein [Pontivivens insulae]SPF28068.1 hypothetical protein POI8812_00366 [Pontivivens insulae]
MKMIAICVALVLTPLSALADSFCEDLWFTRNALADRGGYCFSSTLGRAVFDNDGCTGSTSALAANDRAVVSRIVELEAEAQCAVDTEAQGLDLPDLPWRRTMIDLPVADGAESGCLGWRGGRALLHAGAGAFSRVTGSIEPGDVIISAHEAIESNAGGRWIYVTVHPRTAAADPVSAGWTDEAIFSDCSSVAG